VFPNRVKITVKTKSKRKYFPGQRVCKVTSLNLPLCLSRLFAECWPWLVTRRRFYCSIHWAPVS